MDRHETVLGALFLGLGVFGLLGMIVVVVVFFAGSAALGAAAAQEPDFPVPLVFLPAGFGLLIGLVILLTTIPDFIAAYGLMTHRAWGLTAALIAGVLNLPHFPLGTGVGIYAIWVFVQRAAPGEPTRIGAGPGG